MESALLDLVERRNELAHAYAVPDDILAVDQIVALVNVVEAYLGIVEEAANARLLAECERSGAAIVVGTVAQRWSGHIGLDAKAGPLVIGEPLVFRRKGGQYIAREVASLMLNDALLERVDGGPDGRQLRVGVGFADSSPLPVVGSVALMLPEGLADLVPAQGA